MTAAVVPDLSAQAIPVSQLGPVHLIGAGGAGMSAIARLLLARGVQVSGSDARSGPVLDALTALGARMYVGHRAEQVPAEGTVVVSSAVRASNPELITARAEGLRVLHRSEALASLMLGRRAVAVAGTHGKTTTTGMIATVLSATGCEPSFAIGGELTDGGVGAVDGASDIFVAEADESDGSFLLYRPHIAVITNIEADHLDHYGSAEAVEQAFAAFARNVQDGGAVVACGCDPGARRVLTPLEPELRARQVFTVWYGDGRDDNDDVTIRDFQPTIEGSRFVFDDAGEPEHPQPVTLRVPGMHNALNAAAAWIVALRLGVDEGMAAMALGVFGGTKRRFEVKGTAGDVRVVDDYAHHPTEVAALLAAARTSAGDGRVIAIFQPHLFSRTRIFASEFGVALGAADEVVVLDVYAAREDPEPGVTGDLIARAVLLPPSRVHFVPDAGTVPALVAGLAQPGDLVLTIGAGDVTALGPAILSALAAPDSK
jgi:UDP-N-acetylmuramate--alanine ligase